MLYAWLGRQGPHPGGNPPHGYREHYKVQNPLAPCPEDFRDQAPATHYPAPAPLPCAPHPNAHLDGLGVQISDSSFDSWMAHTSTLNTHLARLAFEITQIVACATNTAPAMQPPPQIFAPVAPRAMLLPWRGGPPAAVQRGGFAMRAGLNHAQLDRAARAAAAGHPMVAVTLAEHVGGPAGLPAHRGQKKDRKRRRKGSQKPNHGELNTGPMPGAVDNDNAVSLG
ncbi:hypothetical protein LXA43DRAFT_1099094 [Ganoderma leucocontextum]|nr:hypothetical protein LXA43DRAFT_1099094 [Ganoderma leucocontextum]